jgi:hypothetical protein
VGTQNAAAGSMKSPGGRGPPGGKNSSYCAAWRLAMDDWNGPNKMPGKDFNSHLYKRLEEIDKDLFDEIKAYREIPVGAITNDGVKALGSLPGGAAAVQMCEDAVSEGGMYAPGVTASGAIYRLMACSAVRSEVGGKADGIQRILCPDGQTPDGRPIEIKREGEPESHNDQINNYMKATGKKPVVLDAKNCGNE